MSRTLYVGNLPLSATREALAQKFAACGTVVAVKLMSDPGSARHNAAAFIEMASSADAQCAIDRLNLSTYDGRLMSVNRLRAAPPA